MWQTRGRVGGGGLSQFASFQSSASFWLCCSAPWGKVSDFLFFSTESLFFIVRHTGHFQVTRVPPVFNRRGAFRVRSVTRISKWMVRGGNLAFQNWRWFSRILCTRWGDWVISGGFFKPEAQPNKISQAESRTPAFRERFVFCTFWDLS